MVLSKLTISIPAYLLRRAKFSAALRNEHIGDVVRRALEEYVAEAIEEADDIRSIDEMEARIAVGKVRIKDWLEVEETMGTYKDLFLLAAKAGSLEGYSYDRAQFSMQHMPAWIGNIESMYGALPAEVKAECAKEYCAVLETAKKGLIAGLGVEHPLVAKVEGMIEVARAGA